MVAPNGECARPRRIPTAWHASVPVDARRTIAAEAIAVPKHASDTRTMQMKLSQHEPMVGPSAGHSISHRSASDECLRQCPRLFDEVGEGVLVQSRVKGLERIDEDGLQST